MMTRIISLSEMMGTIAQSGRARLLALLLVITFVCYLVWLKKQNKTKAAFASVCQWIKGLLNSRDLHFSVFLYLVGFVIGYFYTLNATHDPDLHFYSPTLGSPVSFWRHGNLLGWFAFILYGIFRLGMSKWVSLVGAIFVASSSVPLYFLFSSPERDFPRGNLILGLIFLMGFVVKRGGSYFRVILCAALLGTICGVGNYFREEVIFFIIPSILVVAFLTPYSGRSAWKIKLAGLCTLVAFFTALVPKPFLTFPQGSSLAGLVSTFNDVVGVSHAPYDIGYLFMDEYIAANMSALQIAEENGDSTRGGGSMLSYVRRFPADFIANIYAISNRLLSLSFAYQLPPQGVDNPVLAWFYHFRSLIQHTLWNGSVLFFVASTILLFTYSTRAVLCYLSLFFMFSILFSIQFWGRFYFYFEFFSWWNVGFLLQAVINLLRRTGNRFSIFWEYAKSPRTRAALVGVVVIFVLGNSTLTAARKYQANTLSGIFGQYLSMKVTNHSSKIVELGNRRLMLPGTNATSGGREYFGRGGRFFKATFGGDQCESSIIYPIIHYPDSDTRLKPRPNWSRTVKIVLTKNQKTELFFPAWSKFRGISVPSHQRGCLLGLGIIDDPSGLPILMTVFLPNSGPYYKTIHSWESKTEKWLYHGNPSRELVVSLRENGRRISRGDLAFLDDGFTLDKRSWSFSGYARPTVDSTWFVNFNRSRSRLASLWYQDVNVAEIDTDLLFTKPRMIEKDSFLLVEGNLLSGGLQVGLTRGEESVGYVSLTSPGPFSVVLKVPETGWYVFGIANKVFEYTSMENRFYIDGAYWIDPNSELN